MGNTFRIRGRIRNFPMRLSVVFLVAFAGAGPYLSGVAAAEVQRASPLPGTPEDAVRQLEAALKAGDVERLSHLYGSPLGSATKAMYGVLVQVGEAKRKLVAAMDERFGRQPDRIPYGDDDEEFRQECQELQSVTLLKKEPQGDEFVLTVKMVRQKAGRTREMTDQFIARSASGGGFQLVPKDSGKLIGKIDDNCLILGRLPAAYKRVAEEVKAGRYASREEARRAAFAAYSLVDQIGRAELRARRR